MREYESENICPYCGYVQTSPTKEVYHLSPGTILKEKYVLGTVIGFGGFGVVYKAYDEYLKRVVAIKEYYPTVYLSRNKNSSTVSIFDAKNENAFQQGKESFLKEARQIAQFNTHPNIVHIYDYFEENGTAYFVMEYMDGYSLKEYINLGKSQGKVIDLEIALNITKSLLETLKVTHKAGIIHRDIKPGNVYMLKDGTVKLFDFGAARLSDEEKEFTRTVIITPGYAPPEQYQVRSKQGPYTDIYAVSAMLYEMVTGIKLEESINRKVEDNVKDPRAYNSTIPKNVSNAIMRALAIQPEIRFKSAVDFIAALESPRQVRHAKAEVRHRKFVRDLRIFGIIALVLCLAIVCGKEYYSRYRKAVLAEAAVEIWVPSAVNEAENTEQMYREMLNEFSQNNPQITLDIVAFEKDEYVDKLKEGLSVGLGPDLFDSSFLEESDHEYLHPINDLFAEDIQLNDYYFLERYEQYFISLKQVPLSFDVPVVYENSLYTGLPTNDKYDDYVANIANYKGSVRDFPKVQEDMAGVYSVSESMGIDYHGQFYNYFSINSNSDKSEVAACYRILQYLLSDTAQEIFTIENGFDLPLNKSIFEDFISINTEFEFLPDELEKLTMQ